MWTRQGQPPGSRWADKVLPYVDSWAEAVDDVVFEDRPHSDEAFADYLEWYLPRTRTRVVHVPPEPRIGFAPVSETYPPARDQNFALAVCFPHLIYRYQNCAIPLLNKSDASTIFLQYNVIQAIQTEATSSMNNAYEMAAPRRHLVYLLGHRS